LGSPIPTTYAPGPAGSPNSSNPSNPTCTADPANATGTTQIAAIPNARYWIRRAIDIVAVATTDVRVPVEIIVVIDVDVVATPAAPPPPAAAPKCSHHHTNAERDCHSRSVVPVRRIVDWRIGIDRIAPDNNRIIRRYIHDLRVGLVDHNHRFALDDLCLDFLLFGGF
jgi:hypothetical protein